MLGRRRGDCEFLCCSKVISFPFVIPIPLGTSYISVVLCHVISIALAYFARKEAVGLTDFTCNTLRCSHAE